MSVDAQTFFVIPGEQPKTEIVWMFSQQSLTEGPLKKKISHLFLLSENSAFDIFWLDQILSIGVSNLEEISGDNGGVLF